MSLMRTLASWTARGRCSRAGTKLFSSSDGADKCYDRSHGGSAGCNIHREENQSRFLLLHVMSLRYQVPIRTTA